VRLATIRVNSAEETAVVTATGLIPLRVLNQQLDGHWPTTTLDIIASGQLEEMNDWYRHEGQEVLKRLRKYEIPPGQVSYALLYRHPPKIWGIGLNYVEHASDLSEKAPTIYPASFMKPAIGIQSIYPFSQRKQPAKPNWELSSGRNAGMCPLKTG